jgi:hypothetical protein
MSSPANSIPNSPLNLYLGVFPSLFYPKFTTQFISWSSPACAIPNSPLNSYLGLHQLVLHKFTTQFISRCLPWLVLSQIHNSIHISVFTSLFYPNSPLNSYLGVFLSLSYPKFTTQFIFQWLLQLVLSQIHHSIHISVFTSLFYPKLNTQFISWCLP